MKKLILVVCTALVVSIATAQSKKQQDIDAIKGMCGCYEVVFNFSETFAPDEEYSFKNRYRTGGLELVIPVEESDNKIVLQHLLVVYDTMIIKHWRQDWVYQNTDLYIYDYDFAWNFVKKTPAQVKGQWTQKVYQVDDSPRYEGTASWVHVDGRHFWENTADSPLPRREFTTRSDYNVMVRGNRHELTNYGWLHDQNNDKVIRSEEGDVLLVSEKGMNTYTRVEASKCGIADKWWSDHKHFWADVRSAWDEVFAANSRLSLKTKVDEKLLFQQMFDLEKELLAAKTYDSKTARKDIKALIQSYINGDFKFASIK